MDYTYKGYSIILSKTENDNYISSCFLGVFGRYHTKFDTPQQALEFTHNRIDWFLNLNPTSYEELSECINYTLIHDDYETSHVDTTILEMLVKKFIKNTNT